MDMVGGSGVQAGGRRVLDMLCTLFFFMERERESCAVIG
jgi:hypothetical protein